MTKFEKRFFLGLAVLVLVLAVLEAMVPQPTDWSPSFSRIHKKPYGSQLVYERLTDIFPEVRAVSHPPSSVEYPWEHVHAERVNHIFLNSLFSLDQANVEMLLEMTAEGDHLFIAAEIFRGLIADTLKIDTESRHWYGMGSDTSDIRFIGEPRIAAGVFRYSRGYPDVFFNSYDTSRTRVLAVNGSAEPVLLEMTWGEGRIVLCSAPLAFTNYNLLKGKNATFMAGAFSVLPYRTVIWDESLKVGRNVSGTPLRYILSQPSLRWAWYLTLALIVFYMLIHVRREQRPIPVLQPLRNSTRDLTHTIGRLYWHKGDHAGIARQMITHFKEEVRTRTYLRTFAYDNETMDHLAAKTGLDREEVARRFISLEQRERAERLSEAELLKLSNELHEFRQLV
jgi:hypothetical protein